jgi:hypothetical protein
MLWLSCMQPIGCMRSAITKDVDACGSIGLTFNEVQWSSMKSFRAALIGCMASQWLLISNTVFEQYHSFS